MRHGHASVVTVIGVLAGAALLAGATTLASSPTALARGGTDDGPARRIPAAGASEEAVDAVLVRRGVRQAARSGCAACHSLDGSRRPGPTWKGLYGRKRPLANGQQVVADEAYLRRSIVAPDAEIAEGFPKGFMPEDFGRKLSEEQIRAIIELIKSVR